MHRQWQALFFPDLQLSVKLWTLNPDHWICFGQLARVNIGPEQTFLSVQLQLPEIRIIRVIS